MENPNTQTTFSFPGVIIFLVNANQQNPSIVSHFPQQRQYLALLMQTI
jgi:hypothetical protein